MPQIDEILSILRNGKWHDIREICEKTRMNALKVELLTNFLLEYNFIELDKKESKTRLTKPLYQFLKKIEESESENA
jgi:DNA-binding IclR family transcriptional regulator